MDYEQREQLERERSHDLVVKLIETEETENSLTRLFPEFSLKGLFGLHKAGEALTKYLVMYDTVIVNLYPRKDAEEFFQTYGVNTQEMKTLLNMGKIHIVLCFPYSEYSEMFSDLVDQQHPRSSRVRDYLSSKTKRSDERCHHYVRNISWRGKASGYPETVFDNFEIFQKSFASDLYDLELVGLFDVVEKIKTISDFDPEYAHKITTDYCNLLAKPIFESLGGVNTFNQQDKTQANKLYLNTDSIPFATEKNANRDVVHEIEAFIGVHPSEIIQFLPDELFVPSFVGVENIAEFVSSIDQDKTVIEFRKLLRQIAKTHQPTENLQYVGEEVLRKIQCDSQYYGIASAVLKTSIHLTANSPAAVPFVFGAEYSNLAVLLGISSATLTATHSTKIENWSNRVLETLSKTLVNRPMLSSFHRANDE